jgi:oligopeptide transport system permease protein
MKRFKIGDRLPLSFQVDYDRPNVFRMGDYDEGAQIASRENRAAQNRMRPSTSFFRDSVKRFLHNPVAMVSLVVFLLLVLAIIIMPFICPYKYDEQLGLNYNYDSSFLNLAPFEWADSEKAIINNGGHLFPHIFGTDALGRDYFIRVIYGTRVSLLVGVFASIIVLVIGSIYGAISGYAGGKVDMVMMRIVDVIYSLPDIILIILISVVLDEIFKVNSGGLVAAFGSGLVSIFIVFALLYWVGMARLVRGQVLTLKQQEYVLAARSIGAKPLFVIRKHLIPNSMSVIIVSAGLEIPSAIFTESFLSFIGLGVRVPMPSLGSLASDAEKSMSTYPYQLFIPAAVICVIVLCLNLIGDGARDAFDPKLQR